MPTPFERDLANARDDLHAARTDLLTLVQSLADADLDKARRGGWSVRAVFEHIVQADWWYARGVASLRELDAPPSSPDPATLDTIRHVGLALHAARAALTDACDGVDEEHFYLQRKIGPQDYSVLSILENSADHDREHAGQIANLAADS